MPVQFKRDPYVIVPYTLFTVGAIVALYMGKINLEAFIAILGALNVASAFGLKKDPPDDGTGGVSVPVDDRAVVVDAKPKPAAHPYRTIADRPARPRPPAMPRHGAGRPVMSRWGPTPRLTAALVGACCGTLVCCASATPQQKADAADSSYAAEMAACVKKSPTIQESRACRAQVRARWGVDGGTR